MKEILKTIKRYRVLLIIGMLLLSLLLFVVIFKNKVTNDNYSRKYEKVQSPYLIQEKILDIDLEGTTTNPPKEGKVLKVLSNDLSFYNAFIEKTIGKKEIDYIEGGYFEFSQNEYLIYSPSSKIFSLKSKKGLKGIDTVSSENEIKNLLIENFGIKNIVIYETEKNGLSTKYKGRYKVKDIEFGSSSLNGYSFVINVNSKGKITDLSLLLLTENNVIEYQYLPITNINTLIKNQRYPKVIGQHVIEERYYDKPRSSELIEFYVNKVSLIYIFHDSENSLILPTYILEGEGKVVDTDNDKYWSKTSILICAINPEYLITREPVKKSEAFEEFGVPYEFPK
ncbi:MAG TPA: hypothetical protein PLN39_01755 [Candidatus Dojkabacteria bacterium]|nr:hypothetical protein [Candidatus Dojkabacteria bacterium]